MDIVDIVDKILYINDLQQNW